MFKSLTFTTVILIACPAFSPGQTLRGWEIDRVIPAPEAIQAAASHGDDVYAIAGNRIAKYDRQTGKRMAVSHGEATHLNSGFFCEGRLYCAHSNYPKTPERSEIKVLDPKTMELGTFKNFGATAHGSLTWAVWQADHWWCTFARYGDDNALTTLVKYDRDWQEVATWKYPDTVIADLGRFSISGGLWYDGRLLATGHDKPVAYVLQLPESGDTLIHLQTVPVPFPGQGIASDGRAGLIGINRARKEIVLARPVQD